MTLPPRAGVAQKNAAEALDRSGKSTSHPKYPMKKLLLSASIFAAFAANATCGHRGIPDEVCEPIAQPVLLAQAPPNSEANASAAAAASAEQRQQQQQAQAQRQQQQQGQQANGNGAGAGAYAGSNSVTIQGAQAGSGDRTLVLSLPSVPATPPSFVASAHMTMMWSPCGPLVRVVAEAVYGESRGLFGGVTQTYLGANEKTVEHRDHMGEIQPYTAINGRWFGHQVLYSGAVPGVASGTNLTIGGAGAGGGGQAGGGTSGGMQRPVERVQVRLCDIGPVVVAAPHVVYPPRATFVPIKPIVRKRIKPQSPCVLEDKTVKICKRTAA